MTIIEQIKAEIERRIKILREDENVRQNCSADFLEGKIYGYEEVISFLSTLEEEDKCYFYCKYGGILPTCSDCKRNLLNSRISKEQVQGWLSPDTHSKRCNSKIQLEEKSEKPMAPELTDEQLDKEVELWYNEYAGNNRFDWIGFARHFAQWGAEHAREQIMKEAVEGSVILRDMYDNRSLDIDFVFPDNLKIGDKVRVIVLKKEN